MEGRLCHSGVARILDEAFAPCSEGSAQLAQRSHLTCLQPETRVGLLRRCASASETHYSVAEEYGDADLGVN